MAIEGLATFWYDEARSLTGMGWREDCKLHVPIKLGAYELKRACDNPMWLPVFRE